MARPKLERKHEVTVRVRLLPEQDELIRQAADLTAKERGTGTLSDWLRETLITAAREKVAGAHA